MKFLFKKRNGQFAENRLAATAGKQFNRVRSGWAGWMQRRTARYTPRRWTVLLVVFVLVSGTYSFYLAASSILHRPNSALAIDRIQKPQHMGKTGDALSKDIALISEGEFKRIQSFKNYMDSLSETPTGKQRYDSIIAAHPGLLDSITEVEKLYNSKK